MMKQHDFVTENWAWNWCLGAVQQLLNLKKQVLWNFIESTWKVLNEQRR
jgi:hypothetical protein